MFFGHISVINKNEYPKAIQLALDYLKTTNFDELPAGRYLVSGDIYAQVLDLETKEKSELLPEVHQKYLDVQYLYSGIERIGVTTDLGNYQPVEPYDPVKDIMYYQHVENEVDLICRAGNFAVFFPEDVHRPGCIDGKNSCLVRKIVVKIPIVELEE